MLKNTEKNLSDAFGKSAISIDLEEPVAPK